MIADTIALRIDELSTKPESLPVGPEEWTQLLSEYKEEHGKKFPTGGTMKIEGVRVAPVNYAKLG